MSAPHTPSPRRRPGPKFCERCRNACDLDPGLRRDAALTVLTGQLRAYIPLGDTGFTPPITALSAKYEVSPKHVVGMPMCCE